MIDYSILYRIDLGADRSARKAQQHGPSAVASGTYSGNTSFFITGIDGFRFVTAVPNPNSPTRGYDNVLQEGF
jgi:hypothetical protein